MSQGEFCNKSPVEIFAARFCRRLLAQLEWLIWQNGFVRCVLGVIVGMITSNRIGLPFDGVEVLCNFRSFLVIVLFFLQPSPISILSIVGIFSTLAAMWALNVYANIVSASSAYFACVFRLQSPYILQRPLAAYRLSLQFRIVQVMVVLFNFQANVLILFGEHWPLAGCGTSLNEELMAKSALVRNLFFHCCRCRHSLRTFGRRNVYCIAACVCDPTAALQRVAANVER